MLLARKEDRIPDLEFGMHNTVAIRRCGSHPFLSAESTLIKVEGFVRIADGETGSDGVIVAWNWFGSGCHWCLLSGLSCVRAEPGICQVAQILFVQAE